MNPEAVDFVPKGIDPPTQGSSQGKDPATSLDQLSKQNDANSSVPLSFRTITVPPEGSPCAHPIGECLVKRDRSAYRIYHEGGPTTLWGKGSCAGSGIISASHFQRDLKMAKESGAYSESNARYPSSAYITKDGMKIQAKDMTDDQFRCLSTIVGASKGYINKSGEFCCVGDHFNLASKINRNIKQKELVAQVKAWSWREKPRGSCKNPICVSLRSQSQSQEEDTLDYKIQEGDFSDGEWDEYQDDHQRSIAKSSVLRLFE